MSKSYEIQITLRVEAPNTNAVETAVEDALDDGVLQEAVNNYSDACDDGDLTVVSATRGSANEAK